MQQLLVSIEDASASIGIGRTKLYELLAEGELTLVKVGRRSLIPVTSIEALVRRLSATGVQGQNFPQGRQ